ncbi:MAG: hypothetical protein AOA65_1518 [Candidatus Bathyarchaeota archaeon BA1]|nr:MAG: hypothetical protein AOA65_1518 [Candidatus Bathyarchaeota archaeon BA1]
MHIAFKDYLSSAPDIKEVHCWDLPPSLYVGFSKIPHGLKLKARAPRLS